MRKELVLSLADLRYVSITCRHCQTQVTLDMRKRSEYAETRNIFAPKKCPGCSVEYDSAIQPAVDAFQRLYQSTVDIADTISFRGESQHQGEPGGPGAG